MPVASAHATAAPFPQSTILLVRCDTAVVELLKSYSQMAQGIQLLHATLQAVLNQYGLSSDRDRKVQHMADFESRCYIAKT